MLLVTGVSGALGSLVAERPLGGAEPAAALGAAYAPGTLADARAAVAASGVREG